MPLHNPVDPEDLARQILAEKEAKELEELEERKRLTANRDPVYWGPGNQARPPRQQPQFAPPRQGTTPQEEAAYQQRQETTRKGDPIYWGPDVPDYERHVQDEQLAQQRRAIEFSLQNAPPQRPLPQPQGRPTHLMPDGTKMPGATHGEAPSSRQREADNIDRMMWESDRPETWGGDGAAWESHKQQQTLPNGRTVRQQAELNAEAEERFWRGSGFSNPGRLAMPPQQQAPAGQMSVPPGGADPPDNYEGRNAFGQWAYRQAHPEEFRPPDDNPPRPDSYDQRNAFGKWAYRQANEGGPVRITGEQDDPRQADGPKPPLSAPQSVFSTDKISEHRGMMGGDRDTQHQQFERDEEAKRPRTVPQMRRDADRDFQRLFDEADPSKITTPEEMMENTHTQMQRDISDRNTRSRQARMPVGRPSEEVSNQRIGTALRQKLTGQVDELSNLGGGRLAGLQAANTRARDKEAAELEANRQAFLSTGQGPSMGPGRPKVNRGVAYHGYSNEESKQRILGRRANVRANELKQKLAGAEFRENKAEAEAAEQVKQRDQWAWGEDMRQGGDLGIIRGKQAADAQSARDVIMQSEAEKDRVNVLKAAEINAGSRPQQKTSVEEARERAYEEAKSIVGAPQLFDEATVARAREVYKGFFDEDAAEGGSIVTPGPSMNREEESAANNLATASDNAQSASSSIGAVNNLIAAINQGTLSYAEAQSQAADYGPEALEAFNRYALDGMGTAGMPAWTKNVLGTDDLKRRVWHGFRQQFLE